MKTVQMTLNEDLVREVDRVARELKTTRSAFTRHALQDAVSRFQTRKLEEKHRKGYQQQPVKKGEFDVWEKEQEWGEE